MEALNGLKVIEFASGLAGHFAGVVLADLGATVIKVERPGGEPLRSRGPSRIGEDSLYFQTEARGKKSVVVNVEQTAGRRRLEALIPTVHAVIEDFGPGGLEERRLPLARLFRLNEALCVLRLSPFGAYGPLAGEKGDDRIAQSFSGAAYVTGSPDKPPRPFPVPIGEYLAGVVGANGLLLALLAAETIGHGQVIDLALYEPLLRFQEEMLIQYDQLGIIRERTGNEHPETVPSNHYETKDHKWVAIAAANNQAFGRIVEAIGRRKAGDDPRFVSPASRVANRIEVNALIASWVLRHSAAEVVERFDSVSAPIALIQSIQDIFDDPQYEARRDLIEVPGPSGRTLTMQAVTPRLSRTPGRVRGPAPRLGEHTDEIMRGFALDRGDVRVGISRDELKSRATGHKGALGVRPLDGLRVIDIGRFIAGPVAAVVMAEFGAEVIKVELPESSASEARARHPQKGGVSLAALMYMRNKKSITLDAHSELGRAVFLDLARVSDVVIENFRPGTLDRWGLGYDALRRANPGIVLVSISGFGDYGPYMDRSGFDQVGLAMSGLSYLGGSSDGPPIRPGVLLSDYMSAQFALLGTLAALFRRRRDGLGQQVELSLYESVFRILGDTPSAFAQLNIVRGRQGTDWPCFPFCVVGESSDGSSVTISAILEEDVEPSLLRMGIQGEAREGLLKWIADRTGVEAEMDAREAGLAASMILNVRDLIDHPHLKARNNVVTIDHPTLGKVREPGVVPKLSGTPGVTAGGEPEFGGSNDEVYRSLLGYSQVKLDELAANRVI